MPPTWRRCGRSADLRRGSGRRRRAARHLPRLLRWLGPEGWFSDIEAELAALPGGYDAILLARDEEEIVGCVALHPLDGGACEMKRLYVSLGFRRIERYNDNPIEGPPSSN